MNKEDNQKEKFKKALISTVKVISDDYKLDTEIKKNLSSKNYNFFELDNLSNRNDYIKFRAETDSEALKRKFSNKEIYQKNLPKNSSCRLLYDIAEKIRYELLGSKMLKGISKNLSENYNHKITLKRKDQLKTKEDVSVSEAFELYMLKNFFHIKLNRLSNKILSFWEKDFKSSLDQHLHYLSKNLENQENYNSKFSKLLEKMEIFDSDDSDEKQDNLQDDKEQDNNPNKDSDDQSAGDENKTQQDEDLNGIDTDYDFNEYSMEEELVNTDSEQQSSETIIQKNEYKY